MFIVIDIFIFHHFYFINFINFIFLSGDKGLFIYNDIINPNHFRKK